MTDCSGERRTFIF